MTREERARQQERISRRERIRRKKGRRLRRKIRNACCLTILTAVLCVASGLLISCLKWTGVLPNSPSYEIEPPVIRTENEVKERIEELAKKDRGFKEILKNYDEYPEVYLAALANNPEMLDYVKGYLKHEKLDAALTKKDTSASYPLFLQWDRRWGYASYGDKSSIGISGCGPTCLAMVAYALTKDASVTPFETAQYSEIQGYYVDGTGTSWELMTKGAEAFGIKGSELSLNEDQMKRALDAEHPIICAMGPGDFTTAGHFIMIYGYDKKGFSVNDPNSRARSSKKWTYEELSGQIKNLWAYQS